MGLGACDGDRRRDRGGSSYNASRARSQLIRYTHLSWCNDVDILLSHRPPVLGDARAPSSAGRYSIFVLACERG